MSALRFKGLIGDNLLIEYTRVNGNYVLRRQGEDVLTFPAICDLEELADELQQVARIFRQLEGKAGSSQAPKLENASATPPPPMEDADAMEQRRRRGGRPRKSRDEEVTP